MRDPSSIVLSLPAPLQRRLICRLAEMQREDTEEQVLLGVAEGEVVALSGGGGAATAARASAERVARDAEGGVDLNLVEHVGAGGGGGDTDGVGDVAGVVLLVLVSLCKAMV